MADCLNPTKWGRCRKCVPCIENRMSAWVFRMILESQLFSKHMVTTITLTYRNEDLPTSNAAAKAQFQKFMKRLRKDLGFKVRYFAALEKGTLTLRYHWHVIFFGLPYSFETRKYLDAKWGHGFVRRFEVIRSPAAMRYAAKYALKDKCYLMSRVPPLGTGMIQSINNTIKSLSKEERIKIISNRIPMEVFDRQCGFGDKDKLFTISSLRHGGYYFPLHDFIKKRLYKFKSDITPLYEVMYESEKKEK